MLPRCENRCHRQEWQFDGADLAKKWCKEICAHTPEISNGSIQSLGNGHFYVRSAADLVKMYLVDLSKDVTNQLTGPLPWWDLRGRGSPLIRFGLARRWLRALPSVYLHTSPRIVPVRRVFSFSRVSGFGVAPSLLSRYHDMLCVS